MKSGQDHPGFVDGGGAPNFRGDEEESIKEAAEWDGRQAKGISNTARRRVRHSVVQWMQRVQDSHGQSKCLVKFRCSPTSPPLFSRFDDRKPHPSK